MSLLEEPYMNLKTTIEFLTRLYESPEGKNLTRLEHEAIGDAIRRLRALQGPTDGPARTTRPNTKLRVITAGNTERRHQDTPHSKQ